MIPVKLQIVLILAILNCSLVQAQNAENKIVIGHIDSIHSKVLNEQRKLWIYVPDSGPAGFYSKNSYPVIYLLDGDGHFNSVAGMVEYLSAETICPQMIIVGIPNTDRFRDLTPTKPALNDEMPLPPSVGGGEAFTSFIEKELIPYIESNYTTAPYRVMIGHSLGGLMVINTLLHHSHLFNSYLAIDPSLWWDNDLMIRQADSVFQNKSFTGKSLFMSMANSGLPEGIDVYSVLKDTSGEPSNARPIVGFADLINKKKSHGLRSKFQYYPDDTHGSVPFISEYEALRFFFNQYTFPASIDYQIREPAYNADSAIVAHYRTASEQMGYTVLPPENLVNQNAYSMMYNNDMDRAFKLFDLNVKNYPKSFNVYDSMGDYYLAKNETKNAGQFFIKALEIKDVQSTRKKLESLQGK